MKTIRKTMTFAVPNWAAWQTTDADGALWVWELVPQERKNDYHEQWTVLEGRGVRVGKIQPPLDWRKTKRRIK